MVVGIALGLVGRKLGGVHYALLTLAALAVTFYEFLGGGS